MGDAGTEQSAFVGREPERAVLVDALRRLDGGRGGIGLVEGVAGIGKTRLVEEARASARAAGITVLSGAGDEMDRDWPFGPLVTGLDISVKSADPARARIAQLLRGGDDIGPHAQHAVIEAFIELVDAEAAEHGLLLVIEDLHWADRSTLLTLHHLARRLPELSPVLILATMRPVAPATEMGRLASALEERGAWRTTLAPLSPGDQAELVSLLVGARPGPLLLDSTAKTGGSPLYVNELVRALLADGAISVDTGTAEIVGPSVPPSLQLTILRRLGFLSDELLATLRWASVLGTTFDIGDLALVAGTESARLAEQVAALRRAGVVVEAGKLLGFAHALVRGAIYEETPAAERRLLHRHVARTLAGAGTPALRVATHFRLAAVTGDDDAVEWLRRAAEETMTDPATVVALLDDAIELLPAGDPRADALRARSLVALVDAGQVSECERRAAELIAARPEPSVARDARRGLIYAYASRNRWTEALPLISSEVDDATADDRELPDLLVDGAVCRATAFDIPGALDWCARARELAAALGDDTAWVRAAGGEAEIVRALGWLPRAVELQEQAVATARRSGSPVSIGWGLGYLAVGLASVDRLEEAEQLANSAIEQFRDATYPGMLSRSHWIRAGVHYHAGRWDDALTDADAALEILDSSPVPRGLFAFSDPTAPILYQRDELEAARVAEARVEASFSWLALSWTTRSLLRAAQGEIAQAVNELDSLLQIARTTDASFDMRVGGLELFDLVRRAGRTDLATALVAQAANASRRAPGVMTLEALAQLLRGLDTNDPDLMLDAVATYRWSPRPVEVAAAFDSAGTALAGGDRRDEGVGLLIEATERYAALGAERARARTVRRLRDVGVRHGERGPRRRPPVGWESLTPAETNVVEFVAQGLSNREIGERLYVSHRTVATHLKHIFQKLSVSSRVELTAAATRRAVGS